ncbi:hypothetical protein [Nocardia albiluteola]|uniref:hypothetical protein n=1 Tax=Nocardia albiluteola TaxID=2842303 RepID=UPI0027E01F82|nr:hypothetical protein [Nocardia albiluteola]
MGGGRIEQTRHIAAELCGRRLYEAMLVWETAEQTMSDEDELEFARIWRPIPKVVFSRTLTAVEGNARLATDDLAKEIAGFRDQPGEGVVSVAGTSRRCPSHWTCGWSSRGSSAPVSSTFATSARAEPSAGPRPSGERVHPAYAGQSADSR